MLSLRGEYNMLSVVKTGLRTGMKNWTTLLLFIITYKIMGFILVIDFIKLIKSYILSILGITFIGQQNAILILQNPITFFLFICIILILIYYIYLEIVALFLYCEAGWQGNKVTLWKLWKNAFLRSVHFFHIKNLPVVIAMIPLIGLSIFPLTYGFMNKLQIPEFILDYIYSSPILHILFVVCMLLFNILAFFCLFSLPDAIIQKKHNYGSLRSSIQLMKGKVLKTAVILLSCVFTFIIIAIIFATVAIVLLWAFSKISPSIDGERSFFQFHLTRWSSIGRIFFSSLLPASLYSGVITLYHQYRGNEIPKAKKIVRTPKLLLSRAITILASFISLTLFSETELGGNLYTAYSPSTEVVAHRAGATFAPENTLAALNDSIKAGAKMAEIDVQQTIDGVLIIMHDSNFLRTTGLDQAVWETDFATVQTLDAGSFFSNSFAGEHIPTLGDMLMTAKGRIQLMIELKSTGHEYNLVEQTIHQIKITGMESECVIASMDIDLLQQSKKLAPEIETVYISSLVFSERFDLDYVDAYSIETSFLTLPMVTQIQHSQKKIYAWTANSDTTIKKIIRLGADGLITDNPRLASFYLLFYDKNYFVDEVTELLYH